MKRISILSWLRILSAILFFSCSKDENGNASDSDIQFGTITAVIDSENVVFTAKCYKFKDTTSEQTYYDISQSIIFYLP